MAAKRPASPPLSLQQKRRQRQSGLPPSVKKDIDLHHLKPSRLDEAVINISDRESKFAEAFSMWPNLHPDHSRAQWKYIQAMSPRAEEFLDICEKHPDDRPNIYRCRRVVEFFISLSEDHVVERNPPLKKAIQYRQAYWLNAYIFQRQAPEVGKEFAQLGQGDGITFYEEVIENAIEFISRAEEGESDTVFITS
ncbi:hypothetical protein HRR83_007556 [Exophiala dermatitidis]|nr:hypothetical protein HRR75_006427 [Exophiala dermatitidis]KAJ4510530.1 hypothetical protein HRR74_007002 [Exophiala dermatitidis]KAJ4510537.1 hypothetical protein HRR73_006609 [Exophiala dermatitidis]KAJ4531565.1 hypothetical protein HRR77_009415 [Exophiala dermatitidis]KAJ4535147.1 hypothetical protein HRR76_007039 [Exophiala dermatitidis]